VEYPTKAIEDPMASVTTNPPKALSRSEVVEAIRKGILGGELVPGQRLVEAELCESFGASRGVVRSALMDLVHEELLEHIPNRGARVRVVSLQEALQISEVRMAVESLCVARAAEKITDKEIEVLRGIGNDLERRAEAGDTMGFAEATHQVFKTYVRIADQAIAEEILVRLRDRNTRHRFRLTYRSGRARVSLPFWLDIIDAICSRDPEAAQKALRRFAENVQEAMKALADDRTVLGLR
jgi:DNA-binding GntR family transcriptional regulator